MYSLSNEVQRGMTLLETAGIAVVLSGISILALGSADLFSKTVTLSRAVEKSASLISTHPMSLQVTNGGDISLVIREDTLTEELTQIVEEAGDELKDLMKDLPQEGYLIEAYFQPVSIDSVTGAFSGFGIPSTTIRRGELSLGEGVPTIAQELTSLAGESGIDGSSSLAEPTAQRVFSDRGWRFMPQSVVAGIRVAIDTSRSPTYMIQKALNRPSYLIDVKAIHLRGGLQ